MEKGKLALKQEYRPGRSIFDSTTAVLSMFLANTELWSRLFLPNYQKLVSGLECLGIPFVDFSDLLKIRILCPTTIEKEFVTWNVDFYSILIGVHFDDQAFKRVTMFQIFEVVGRDMKHGEFRGWDEVCLG